MIPELKKTIEQKMQKSIEVLKADLAKVRTGRAHTGLLDHVQVEYYGSMVPVNQVANVTLIDARTIGVQAWEKPMMQKVEKAIRDSDLGLNPSNQGEIIRVPMPALTEELHLGRRAHSDLAGLAPAVFATADAGDAVAQALVDRQADEVVAFVRACVTRLDLAATPVPVVLGGSILRAGHARLDARIAAGIAGLAPRARITTPSVPPIEGAVMLALAAAGAPVRREPSGP